MGSLVFYMYLSKMYCFAPNSTGSRIQQKARPNFPLSWDYEATLSWEEARGFRRCCAGESHRTAAFGKPPQGRTLLQPPASS